MTLDKSLLFNVMTITLLPAHLTGYLLETPGEQEFIRVSFTSVHLAFFRLQDIEKITC